MTVRHHLTFDDDLSQALEALVRRPGGNKSKIVSDALRQMLARQGAKEIDDLFKMRLDRISRDIALCRKDVDIVLEALALFVRYQLTVTAPFPEADAAAIAIGNERFERFIVQLGRQIAMGSRALDTAKNVEDNQ